MRAAVRRQERESPTHLIEFARFTHDGHVTKIRTGCVRNVRMYVIAHRWRLMVSAGDRLGVDCSCGRKKAAQQPLVLGVPAISSRISPTMVNIRVYTAYHTGSNFINTSIMCKSREFN